MTPGVKIIARGDRLPDLATCGKAHLEAALKTRGAAIARRPSVACPANRYRLLPLRVLLDQRSAAVVAHCPCLARRQHGDRIEIVECGTRLFGLSTRLQLEPFQCSINVRRPELVEITPAIQASVPDRAATRRAAVHAGGTGDGAPARAVPVIDERWGVYVGAGPSHSPTNQASLGDNAQPPRI